MAEQVHRTADVPAWPAARLPAKRCVFTRFSLPLQMAETTEKRDLPASI